MVEYEEYATRFKDAGIIVDDGDIEALLEHTWYVNTNGYVRSGSAGYMHRFLLGIEDPSVHVDHANRNPLDNRRSNLRIATVSENMANKVSYKGASQYKGVSTDPNNDEYWTAKIQFKGSGIFLGSFFNEVNAAYAYDQKAIELYGEFALTNGIDENDLIEEPKRFKSIYKGVTRNSKNRWRAEIRVNKKAIHLGCFENEIDAARAFDRYVLENDLQRKTNGIDD